jgi:hypothetical protein
MTQDPSEVSPQDEAKQIFEAARLNIGNPDDNISPAGDRVSPDPDESASASNMASDEPVGPAYASDDRFKADDTAGPSGSVVVVYESEILPARAEAEVPTDPTGRPLFDEPAAEEPEVTIDSRFQQSPRDALRSLQHKAEDARRSGLLE